MEELDEIFQRSYTKFDEDVIGVSNPQNSNKTNSEDETDNYRMYSLVLYSLSPIQKGIQSYHATVDYIVMHTLNDKALYEWADNDKTVIILDGGTTNDSVEYTGTMQQHMVALERFGVPFADFREPDLGNEVTAISFLVSKKIYGPQVTKFEYKPPRSQNNDKPIYGKRRVVDRSDSYNYTDKIAYFEKWCKENGFTHEEGLFCLWLKKFRLAS